MPWGRHRTGTRSRRTKQPPGLTLLRIALTLRSSPHGGDCSDEVLAAGGSLSFDSWEILDHMVTRRARCALPLAVLALLGAMDAGTALGGGTSSNGRRARGAADRAMVACAARGGPRLRYKPRACSFRVFAEGAGRAAVNARVRSLRWRNWGSPTASASGIQVGSAGLRQRVTVTLSALQSCGKGKRSYRQVGISQPTSGR